jgi:DNA polymerase I
MPTNLPPISAPVKSGDHVFLVDGSGYIFRAFHALPPLTRKSDGTPVGAVSGFCNMMLKLVRDTIDGEKPSHLAVIFDAGSKTFRNDIYDKYKANRSETPPDLIPQFGLIREATRAFDIACIEQQGFEADDLIATYTRQAVEAGATVTIVSSDKDLMQLVSDQVSLYDTMKNKRITRAEVIEKFGLGPESVVDIQALAGDASDNVPGVPGIGVKTAAQLLEVYGNLEALLERAGEIKQPKRREALIENADMARISKRLVQLDAHMPLDVSIESMAVHEPDPKRLIAFLKAMEFASVTKRVADIYGVKADEVEADARLVGKGVLSTPHPSLIATPSPSRGEGSATSSGDYRPSPIEGEGDFYESKNRMRGNTPNLLANTRKNTALATKIDYSQYETITTLAQLDAWISVAIDAGIIAVDTETNSLDPMQAELVGVSMALAAGKACYIPLQHKAEGTSDLFGGGGLAAGQIPLRQAIERLKPLLENPAILKIGQNIKFDWLVFAQHGIELQNTDDTMLMSYALDAGRGGHGMDDLSQKWLDHAPIKFKDITGTGKAAITFDKVAIDKASNYAAEDADVTYRLWQVLKPRLAAENMITLYERLERPMPEMLARMEQRGIAIDSAILAKLSGEFAIDMARLELEVHELAGETFNLASPKQLGDLLFGKLGLQGGTKTATGAWATGAQILEDLAEQGHELPRRILDWRGLAKLKSTYTDALPNYVNPKTKRVHTSFSLASTTTGRLSSSEPNIQNIPVRNEAGRKIRTAFIAGAGHKLLSADYSQIELRILAHMANIPQLRQAFADGVDIHAMTASEMFGVPLEGMPSDVRRRAKAINFGIIYGISAFGLANQLGIAREEAGAYIKKYFERFPGIKDYMESTKAFLREHGYVATIFGRKCHYPQIATAKQAEKAFYERAAINAPIQGSAADIIRRAMVRMDDALAGAGLNGKMLLQVHDELIFEVPDAEVERTITLVKKVMIDASHPALTLKVPLQVDARAAQNWDEAH